MAVKSEQLPDTDIAVLGLLMEKPSYGYEIEQRVESRGYRNWTNIEQSSIYNSLRRLERNGLVRSEKKEAEGRLRRIYHPTDEGIQTLQNEVYRLLSDPPRPVSGFDLGIANIYALSRDKAIQALQRYRQSQQQGVEFLREHAERMRSLGVVVAAWLFERPAAELAARVVWLDKTIEELKTLQFPSESGNKS
jgi:DNA-binding PadR family transcriptional regulator